MKTKKNHKKNRTTRNNFAYTPGRNVFGDKAQTRLVVLERETAFKQMIDCLCQLYGDSEIEFTFDMSCFIGHEDELDALMEKVNAFLALKCRLSHMPYYSNLVKTA